MSKFLGTEFEGWTENFGEAKCHHEEMEEIIYHNGQRDNSGQCQNLAVCVAIDQHGYYLGCFCEEHRPAEEQQSD